MEIHTLEALADNYMYLIVDAATRAGAVVDPADPDVVMEAVQRLGVTLTHARHTRLERRTTRLRARAQSTCRSAPDRSARPATHAVAPRFGQVLTTHHHFDHAGGNDRMKALVPGIVVVGGATDEIQGMTHAVNDGDTLQVGAGLTLT